MTKIKEITSGAAEDTEQWEPIVASKSINGTATMKNGLPVSHNAKSRVTI